MLPIKNPAGPWPYPSTPLSPDKLFAHLIFKLGVVHPAHDYGLIHQFTADFGLAEEWVLRQLEWRLQNLSDRCH
jgi:hypothetical protein